MRASAAIYLFLNIIYRNLMKIIKKKSNSETGHMKNLMNFEDLLARYRALNERYNPGHPNLQLSNLEQSYMEAQQVFERLTMAKTLYDNATNARAELFAKLNPLTTRIVNFLIAGGVSAKTLEDARGFQRKIQGTRVAKKQTKSDAVSDEINTDEMDTNGSENGETTVDNSRSSARLSYDLKIEHFAKLLSLVQNEPTYQPHEPELQIMALQEFLQQLRSVSTNKAHADAEMEVARRERTRVLYNPETGLVPLAKQSKAYTKAALGATSEDFKHIQRISFMMFK